MFFPRNARPYGLKRKAFQTGTALHVRYADHVAIGSPIQSKQIVMGERPQNNMITGMEADIHCMTEEKQVKRRPVSILIKMLFLSVKPLLFLLVVIIAYNFFSALFEIYAAEWYSLHFENDAIALFFGSCMWFQIMFFLRFTGIRSTLLVAGGCGMVVMAIKLGTPPAAALVSKFDSHHSFPSESDVIGLIFYSAILFAEGLLYPYVVRSLNFIVISPIKCLFSWLQRFSFEKGKIRGGSTEPPDSK